MSGENQQSDKPCDKRGIFLTSPSPISLKFCRTRYLDEPDKYTLTYVALSESPISLSFGKVLDTNPYVFVADRSGSESDSSEPPIPPNKKQRRHEERELLRFWQSETGMLPEALTRIPKTDHARLVQHTTLIETCHLGKSYIASLRAENDRLAWERDNHEKEVNRQRQVVMELQMRCDILERRVRDSPTTSPKPESATPQKTPTPPRKSTAYQIPTDASPNDSIFTHMAMDQSIRREDAAVLHVGKREDPPKVTRKPQPLMGIRTSPPNQMPQRTPPPTFNLRGSGHFQFATRGRGGIGYTRGGKTPIRGRGQNRYDDVAHVGRWQQATFHHPNPVTMATSTGTKPTASTSSCPPSTPTSATSTAGPSSTTSGMRITRSTAKKDNKDDDVKEEEEDDDGEVLRCDTSRADERFVSARLEDYEDMY